MLVPSVQGMFHMGQVSTDGFDGCTVLGGMWIEFLLG